jgi:hypothetical protein
MLGNKYVLQFGIILNNEAIMLENFIQIFGMAGIYIYSLIFNNSNFL